MPRRERPETPLSGAFALVVGPIPPGEEGAESARAAVNGSHSCVEGHLSVGWAGTQPVGHAWRSLVVGRLWDDVDVAELLEREGAPGLARLRGKFALLGWEPGAGRAVVAVDQLAAGALFFYEDGRTLAAATELRELLPLLPRRPGPDADSVANWLAGGGLSRGQTLYEGVRRLEGGRFLEIEGACWRSRPYWRVRYQSPLTLSGGEAAEAVRNGVAAAVERRTSAASVPGILLSGGLDSASVAAGAKVAGVQHLRSYSAVFPEHPTIDEGSLIAVIANELRVESTTIGVRSESMVAPGIRYLRRWGVPSVSPNLFLHRPLLGAAASDGVDVLLDGQGGDELFGCAAYLLADRLGRGRVISAFRLARRVPGVGAVPSDRVVRRLIREFGFKGLLPLAVHRAARRLREADRYSPPWLRARAARLATERNTPWAWKRLDGPRWWAQLADEVTMQRERFGAHDFLRRKNDLASLEGAHPLLDDLDLIELVLRLPPELSFDPELDRPLLRAATAGLLPDLVRLRREKSYFNALFATCLDGIDGSLVRRLLTARDAEVRAYVQQDAATMQLLDPPPEKRPQGWGWAVWRLIGVECWLRAESDPEFLDRVLD